MRTTLLLYLGIIVYSAGPGQFLRGILVLTGYQFALDLAEVRLQVFRFRQRMRPTPPLPHQTRRRIRRNTRGCRARR
jgi:hypothetical protein